MNPTETLQNLDENFLFLLNLTKNHQETFADRPDKDILLHAWLHKLCIETDYEGIDQKRNRNVYLCKLLACMQMRRLTGPFLQRPRPGKLKQWPLPMPVLVEPQWVRDLEAASKKATRIGGKDLKTYISTKRLDNNRGLCALLSVSVADERGEPGFKRMGANQVWEDVEKEFVGMEAQIAAEPPSPRKLPVEKIVELEEELQDLEARIPPEPLPLPDIVESRTEKKKVPKKVFAPTARALSEQKVAQQKPKLVKPTPPRHKSTKKPLPTAESSPISPDQAAFNALEARIRQNMVAPNEDTYRKMATERNLALLTKQREQQKERQRQLEAQLFAKTPSPQKEENELEPTPPIVRELREKQERRILRQRQERMERMKQAKLQQRTPTPPQKRREKSPVNITSTEKKNAERIRQRQLEAEISKRQLEAQMRQQQMEESYITPPRQQTTESPQQRRATPTPPTPEMPEWIRKKYAGKSPIRIQSSEEMAMDRERQATQSMQKTRKKASEVQTTLSRMPVPGSKRQPPKSTVIVSSSKTTQLQTTTVKQSSYGLKPPSQSLMRQPSATGLKTPSQASVLRPPGAKESAYGLKPTTPSLMRQQSGIGLKAPSQASGLRPPGVKESGHGLKPTTPSLLRQRSGIGLKAPSQSSGLRSAGIKPPTQPLSRQPSSTGLKPPSQLKFPKRV